LYSDAIQVRFETVAGLTVDSRQTANKAGVLNDLHGLFMISQAILLVQKVKTCIILAQKDDLL
jgi:hypothetical protein